MATIDLNVLTFGNSTGGRIHTWGVYARRMGKPQSLRIATIHDHGDGTRRTAQLFAASMDLAKSCKRFLNQLDANKSPMTALACLGITPEMIIEMRMALTVAGYPTQPHDQPTKVG